MASSGKDLEYTVNGVTKSVSLFNSETGEMKSTYEVLSEVASSWDKMSNAEQSSLALQIAGKIWFLLVQI